MHVGGHDSRVSPFDSTQFKKVKDVEVSFSIALNSDGKFQSLTMPSGLTIFQKNLVKGWAAQLQINSGEIKKGNRGFVSTEVSNMAFEKTIFWTFQRMFWDVLGALCPVHLL
jgi:hypothetical protein